MRWQASDAGMACYKRAALEVPRPRLILPERRLLRPPRPCFKPWIWVPRPAPFMPEREPARMANPSIVQSTFGTFTSGTSVTVHGINPVVAGNVLVVSLSLKGASQPTGLTPPAGGWTAAIAETGFVGNNGTFRIWFLPNAPSGSFSNSWTWTNSATAGSWTFSEWQGANQATPTDGAVVGTGTSGSTAVTIPSITPTAGASDTWLAFGFVFGPSTLSGYPSSGFTSVTGPTTVFNTQLQSEALSSSGATGTATYTLGTSSPNTGVSMLLQPSVAASSYVPPPRATTIVERRVFKKVA